MNLQQPGQTLVPTLHGKLGGILYAVSRSQWPRGLRRRSAAARLLRLWVRIPPGAWMSVCCECCVFSGRGLCDELITRLEESYRLWCVVVCDLETSWMRRPWPTGGCRARNKIICSKHTAWLYSQLRRLLVEVYRQNAVAEGVGWGLSFCEGR